MTDGHRALASSVRRTAAALKAPERGCNQELGLFVLTRIKENSLASTVVNPLMVASICGSPCRTQPPTGEAS